MSRIEVAGYVYPGGWAGAADAGTRARECCEKLEAGHILYFPDVPFEFPEPDRQTLLSRNPTGAKVHKNISYRPAKDALGGLDVPPAEQAEVRRIMREYATRSAAFLGDFLRPYAGRFALDYGSFRPIEEAGRNHRLHKRNDLLHVDSFPTRPTGGGRILRLFTNINPDAPRKWITGDPFPVLAARYAKEAGLDRVVARDRSPIHVLGRAFLAAMPGNIGIKGRGATTYDRFMLHFHDYMKENETYQCDCAKYADDFPPGSTWMVYTDAVPHAVLSGCYAIEQTFIVSVEAMVKPEVSPLRVLERLSGAKLGA